MSIREYPGGPISGDYARGRDLSGATTGQKASYTVPAGQQAKLLSVTVLPTAGAATLSVFVKMTGTNVRLISGTGAMTVSAPISMLAGDQVVINCDVADAASLFDSQISVELYGAV